MDKPSTFFPEGNYSNNNTLSNVLEPPLSGESYIRSVRREANHFPSVTVADIIHNSTRSKQTSYMPSFRELQSCRSELLPSCEWQEEFLERFSVLHACIERHASGELPLHVTDTLPSSKDRDAWRTFCLGTNEFSNGELQALPLKEGHSPSLRIVSCMDQISTISALSALIEFILRHNSLSSECASWVYILLARLEKPIESETSWQLRQLYRECAQIRSNINDNHSKELIYVNMVVTIVEIYFEQKF
eukprot:711160_1